MPNINVLNTDADVSGKTLVTAEGSRTITGLLTFDRDPNAPFAVSSASAVVPNLIADDVDGPASSYVPTFNGTLGDGTLTGAYIQIGKFVYYEISLTLGSTTTLAGGGAAVALGLPTTASAASRVRGTALLVDNGTGSYTGVAFGASTTTVNLYIGDGVGAAVTATTPATWTTNDAFFVSGFLIAA